MAEYQGQVLLIVNTAPGCGLAPQYKELQELYDSYKDKGFVVLDFLVINFKSGSRFC